MAEGAYYERDGIALWHGDNLALLRTLGAGSVDAVVTDPPYGLEFMGREWDSPWKAGIGGMSAVGFREKTYKDGSKAMLPVSIGSTNPTCRNCGGLRSGRDTKKGQPPCRCDSPMFDNILAPRAQAFQAWCQGWAEACLRVLKPGGYLVAFGGTRTFHRLACAIEDAGFEIRDHILCWITGQGFPKGKGCLKPSWEPIILARKPGPRVLPLGIKECLVQANGEAAGPRRERDPERMKAPDWRMTGGTTGSGPADPQGRWPPNLVLVHTPLCRLVGSKRVKAAGGSVSGQEPSAQTKNTFGKATGRKPFHAHAEDDGLETVDCWECHPSCVVRLLDEQAGLRRSSGIYNSQATTEKGWSGGWQSQPNPKQGRNDSGGASRFFPQFGWTATDDVPFLYCPKASRSEREAGLEELAKEARNGKDYRRKINTSKQSEGGLRGDIPRSNTHPTVKNLSLMIWLVKLVCPVGGKVLDHFAGSGTTGLACWHTGRCCVLMEREEDYCRIAAGRLAGATRDQRKPKPRRTPRAARAEASPTTEPSLFPALDQDESPE